MIKYVHSEILIQYEFIEVLDRVSYNTSVFVIVSNGKAILIDAGYYKFASEIQLDLEKINLEVETIIITHYHRDHAEGSVYFDEANIIASQNYKANIVKCQNLLNEDGLYKTPDIIVNGSMNINFYGINIKIIETPGHTPCGLSVIVNDEYLYVSDMLLEDIDGKIIIPYIDLNSDPLNHLNSLNMYKDLNINSLLLTHGKPKFNIDENKINEILNSRIYYLESFISDSYESIENCLLGDLSNYSMKEIHQLNIRNVKKINR